MLEELFTSVIATEGIAVSSFLTCLAGSLVLGALLAFVFTYRSKTNYTKSFVGTLLILPAVVAIVIMMVSGSIGTGIAVAGTFSLVRFRSIPGTAREIGAIFLAMAVGLACGMGYLGFAAIFAVVMGIVTLFYNLTSLGEHSADSLDKVLRITVPEDLDTDGEDHISDSLRYFCMARPLAAPKAKVKDEWASNPAHLFLDINREDLVRR